VNFVYYVATKHFVVFHTSKNKVFLFAWFNEPLKFTSQNVLYCGNMFFGIYKFLTLKKKKRVSSMAILLEPL